MVAEVRPQVVQPDPDFFLHLANRHDLDRLVGNIAPRYVAPECQLLHGRRLGGAHPTDQFGALISNQLLDTDLISLVFAGGSQLLAVGPLLRLDGQQLLTTSFLH